MIDLSMSGLLLVSDLDGTLVTNKGLIPERNIEAIERFVGKGGFFAFATGRSVLGTEKYAAKVMMNAPSIVYNGGGIYDFAEKRLLWSEYLPACYAGIVKDVRERFPDVGIEVYSGGSVYIVNKNEYTKAHIAFQGITATDKTIDAGLPQSNKVLFCGDSDRLASLAEYVESTAHDGCVCVFSAPIYFEMLPEGISKGATIKLLADMLGVGHDKIMSIGDYYNDMELLAASALCAVPSGAPDDLKKVANIVVGPCDGGAVADFIEHLEKQFC